MPSSDSLRQQRHRADRMHFLDRQTKEQQEKESLKNSTAHKHLSGPTPPADLQGWLLPAATIPVVVAAVAAVSAVAVAVASAVAVAVAAASAVAVAVGAGRRLRRMKDWG